MKSLLLTAMLACASCRTIATHEVSSVSAPDVRVGTRARSWEVHCDDQALGFVVLFQDRGRVHDSVYVVRNAWHQDLGLIDGLGRAYRYLPHAEEPVWVGSGTIAAGARQILGASAECELIELDEHAHDPVPGPVPSADDDAGASLLHEASQPCEAARPPGGLPQSR